MRGDDPHGGKQAGISQTSDRRGNLVWQLRGELAEETLSEVQAVAVKSVATKQRNKSSIARDSTWLNPRSGVEI